MEVSRFKGLGEMPPAALKRHHHGPGPAHPAEGGGAPTTAATADRVESLMGRRPELRFQFIQDNARTTSDEMLDV